MDPQCYPDDILVEILTRRHAPIERRLSRAVTQRLGPRLQEGRLRRSAELLAPYRLSSEQIEINDVKNIIAQGDLDALQSWYYQGRREEKAWLFDDPDIVDIAARFGYLDILRWFETIGLELDYAEIHRAASNYGYPEIVRWVESE